VESVFVSSLISVAVGKKAIEPSAAEAVFVAVSASAMAVAMGVSRRAFFLVGISSFCGGGGDAR
jgi:hypothetical protein